MAIQRRRVIQSSESEFDPNSDDEESVVNELVNANGNGSTSSTSTYSPPKARRSKKASTSANSIASTSNTPHRSKNITPNGSSSIASFIGPAHKPDVLCAFCQGTVQNNFKTGLPEVLISCVECGSSGHPSCMKWGRNQRKTAVAQEYNWRCMECKTCEICCEKGDDSAIMFCDRCDRGWHLYCLNPPLEKPPKGIWSCPTCLHLGNYVKQALQTNKRKKNGIFLNGRQHIPRQASPLASSFGAWEAGANIGSASLQGKKSAAKFKGPMRASSPLPMDLSDDNDDLPSPQTMGQARQQLRPGSSLMGKGRRIRKPTDPDRSYELSASPSASRLADVHEEHRIKSVGRPKKQKNLPQEQANHSMVVRLKISARNRLGGSGRGLGKGVTDRSRSARPSSLAIPDPFPNDEEDYEMASTDSSIPTPRAMSPLDEEAEEEENSEEEDPFGGVLSMQDADTTKTAPQQEDRQRFEQSRVSAETKLGGAVSSLASSTNARQSKKIGAIMHGNGINANANGYFAGTSWAGTGTGGDKVVRKSAKGPQSVAPSTEPSTPSTPITSTATGAETGKAMPIKCIRFAQYDVDTWYQAPYPEEYSMVPDGRLWICEHCFKYMKSRFMAMRHRMKCKMRHPPGAEIYRDGNVSVFEVDGRKNKIYCQNLCLLAKMFLDHKTLYYDVEPFLFYICCEVDQLGAHFVGYFSKEKRSPLNYNLSCIMTLPIRQRRGWGNFLIDLSYLLSKKENKTGSPEKPLSDLGLLSYRNYWTLAVFYYLRSGPDHVSLEDISKATSMTLEDVYYVLREQDMITINDGQSGRIRAPATSKYKSREGGVSSSRPVRSGISSSTISEKDKESSLAIPTDYSIHFDRDYVIAHIKNYEAKGNMKIKPENLHWAPFLFVRSLSQPDDLLGKVVEAAGESQVDQPQAELQNGVEQEVVQEQQEDVDGNNNYDAGESGRVLLHDPNQPDVVLPASAELIENEARSADWSAVNGNNENDASASSPMSTPPSRGFKRKNDMIRGSETSAEPLQEEERPEKKTPRRMNGNAAATPAKDDIQMIDTSPKAERKTRSSFESPKAERILRRKQVTAVNPRY
ncbi:uncharacterized protein FA14DRAFT_161491 [Meira miltonrushii]|uniref:Histone acetyltransferase n=1 Tax=Meira miltonrushii TaxID=1280837 RepID=A0A316V9A1_9BASI|nr:uncharacterized protein FA14DRAFT_161491 [Meira miltonrushii]PWN33824.1 hypothetical protein FA14DRAFT_161491 [Meira miltonrushii]